MNRVLQLLGPSSGGIRQHVATLAKELEQCGVETEVAGPKDVMGSLYSGASVVDVSNSTDPRRVIAAVRQLRALPSFDVIHAHGLKAGLVALTARRDEKVVLTMHNVVLDAERSIRGRFMGWLELQIVKRADFVVGTSEILGGFDAQLRPGASRFVLPASPEPKPLIDRGAVRENLGLDADVFVVVVVARLHPQKDLPTFMKAWKEVVSELPKRKLAAIIVGEGPARAELEALATELEITDSLQLVGASEHAVDQMNAGDLLALSSSWEGVPFVACEAMQLGLPIASTDVGVVAELVGDSGGRVVTVGDHRALGEAIVEIISDPDLAASMARYNAEVGASHYGAHSLVKQIADIYEEVLNNG